MMEDRLTRGFFAGLSGGIVMSLLDYISFYLHFGKERLLDYAAEIILGHRAASLIEALIGQGAQLLFAGVLGVVFSYFIINVKSKNYLFKGWLYGVTIWFAIYTVGRLFGTLEHLPWQTATSNVITASVFGLVLAATLHWMDQTVET
ncbi:YqhR family membrane protein [Desulfotruncus alcoholivorax]|uniref:YqhR family membrane protein n=1 Tax=Desulfotruncus alcoholivorax TaxID=265477 RepID=UPI00041DA993|nr:YqhR family membrane protein [Desulfotruncus alcoholivorax]